MKNTCMIILFRQTSTADLTTMIHEMVDEDTDQVFVRASWRWRMRKQKVQKLLKKHRREASIDLSFHSDVALSVLEFYVRCVMPRNKTEIVTDTSKQN